MNAEAAMSHTPEGEAARPTFAETVGRHCEMLLSAVTAPGAPAWLREMLAVEILRRVWVQKFCRLDGGAGPSEPDEPHILAKAEGREAVAESRRWCHLRKGTEITDVSAHRAA